ncbi:hypothetical protein DFH09DRAFT_4369 [Mycena vulgaris]|nr:hypothetical protein DFH09DRAFT_4369 [Mycena vulgaris]
MAGKGDASWDVATFAEKEGQHEVWETGRDRPTARKDQLAAHLEEKDVLHKWLDDMDQKMDALLGAMLGQRNVFQEAMLGTIALSLIRQSRLIGKEEKAIEEQDVVELHEVLDLCIKGYNDMVFDVSRARRAPDEPVLSRGTKKILKANGIGYLTVLLAPPRGMNSLTAEAKTARKKALRILTDEEQKLCRILITNLKQGRGLRNWQQYPPPDRETALDRIKGIEIGDASIDVLEKFLATNPKRMPKKGEAYDEPTLLLFSSPDSYTNVACRRRELEVLKAEEAEEEEIKRALEEAFCWGRFR